MHSDKTLLLLPRPLRAGFTVVQHRLEAVFKMMLAVSFEALLCEKIKLIDVWLNWPTGHRPRGPRGRAKRCKGTQNNCKET